MKIRTLLFFLMISSISHMNGTWLSALTYLPRMARSAVCAAPSGVYGAVGWLNQKSSSAGLWSLNHPVVTMGAFGIALYMHQGLRNRCYNGVGSLYNVYKHYYPTGCFVHAVDFVCQAHHFFNPTQEEQAVKQAELEQAKQLAQYLEGQVKTHQEQNEKMCAQIQELHAQVQKLDKQLVIARNTEESMAGLSGRFALLSQDVVTMGQLLGQEGSGLVGTMMLIKQEFAQFEGKVKGLDASIGMKIQECLAGVQNLIAQANAMNAQECQKLDAAVAASLERGAQRILEQVRAILAEKKGNNAGQTDC